MQEMISKRIKGLLPLFVVLLVCAALWNPVKVKAAEVKSGKYTYTAEHKWNNSKWTTVIYQQKEGSSRKKLKTLSGTADLDFIYGKNLYFEMDRKEDSTCYDFWALNLDTLKTKKLRLNATVAAHYGKYAVLVPNSGAVVDLPAYVYNVSTNKGKLLTKTSLKAAISDKKIYYANVAGGYNPFKIKIYSCSLSGGSKKAVTNYLYVDYVRDLTSKYVVYYRSGKYYKYTYSTGKTTTVK